MDSLISFLRNPKCRNLESIAEFPLLFVEDYNKGFDNIIALTNHSLSLSLTRDTPNTGGVALVPDPSTTSPSRHRRSTDNQDQDTGVTDTSAINNTLQNPRYVELHSQTQSQRTTDALVLSLSKTCTHPPEETTSGANNNSGPPIRNQTERRDSLDPLTSGTVLTRRAGGDRDREGIG